VAEKAWLKLKPTDQRAALAGINKYNRKVIMQGIAKKYAETYIRQAAWE
jgi:hypothetical protein